MDHVTSQMQILGKKRKRLTESIKMLVVPSESKLSISDHSTEDVEKEVQNHSEPIMQVGKQPVQPRRVSSAPKKLMSIIPIHLKELRQENDRRESVLYYLIHFKCLLKHFASEKKTPGYDGDIRPDRRAFKALIKYRNLVNGSHSIRYKVPGVRKLDKFKYRAEMSLICLHRPNMSGIDYMNVHVKEFRHNSGLERCCVKGNHVSIAVSVVVADRCDFSLYKNTLHLNEIWYKGQGVYNTAPNPRKLRPDDQKAVRGNLALQHSCLLNVPIRVIRTNFEGLFLYDGFYDVKSCSIVEGPNGSKVFEFLLVRRFGGNLKVDNFDCHHV